MRTVNVFFVLVFMIVFNLNLQAQNTLKSENQPKENPEIATITIKSTGLFSKDELIIKYNKSDKKIVQVIENGKEILSEKFHKYESKLHDALEYDKINELNPRIEEINKNLEKSELSDSIKFEEVDEILAQILGLNSKIIETHKELFKLQRKVLGMKIYIAKLQQESVANGLVREGDEIVVKIKKGQFYINGKKVPDELNEKFIQLHQKYSDIEIDKESTIMEIKE